MSLKNKIPVPEMDELRVARMERRIVSDVRGLARSGLHRGWRWARFATAAVAVAGVVLAVVLNLRGASNQDKTAQLEVLPPSQPIEVVTGPGQESRLMLGDAEVMVRENTRLKVERFADGRSLLSLSTGSVYCDVVPRPNRPTFQVVSDDVTVTVLGTAFEVKRDRSVQVRVERGEVSVATSSEMVKLRKGDTWEGSPYAGVPLAVILARLESEENLENEVEDAAATKMRAPKRGVVQSDKRRHLAKGTNSSKPSVEKSPVEEKSLTAKVQSTRPPAPSYAFLSEGLVGELRAVASANPKKAVQRLERVAAESTGRKASAALYARAYLLLFRLGNKTLAAKSVSQYSRRFPKGAHAEDMLWLGVIARCGSEVSSACRSAAHTYLWGFPKGRFVILASRIVNR